MIQLLFDANISWRIVKLLKEDFDCKHISDTGIPEAASDYSIWTYALKNNYTIVTNDEDFYLLSFTKGFPPKVILLRTGNKSTSFIATVILKYKLEIQEFISNKEYGVLEIY